MENTSVLTCGRVGISGTGDKDAPDILEPYGLVPGVATRWSRRRGCEAQPRDGGEHPCVAAQDRWEDARGACFCSMSTSPMGFMLFPSKAVKPTSEGTEPCAQILNPHQTYDRGARSGHDPLPRRKHRRGTSPSVGGRDASSYSVPMLIADCGQWIRGATQPQLDGFTIRRKGDASVKIRIVIHLEQQPEQYKVQPELGECRFVL